MNRDEIITKLRVTLNLPSTPGQPLQSFQNECIRPILKTQNDILIMRFTNDVFLMKSSFDRMIPYDQEQYIRHRIKSDRKLQRELQGVVSGLMTNEEYMFYIDNFEEINKRINAMITERLIDQIITNE